MSEIATAGFGIAFAGLLFATYTDLKHRTVEDYISYGMLGLGLLLHLIQSIATNNWNYLIETMLVTVGTFIGGWLLWKIGFWAGGDVKLFTGIAALLPRHPQTLQAIFGFAPWFTSEILPVFPLSLLVASILAMLPIGIILATMRLAHNKSFQTKLTQDLTKQLLPIFGFAVWYTAISYLANLFALDWLATTVSIAVYPSAGILIPRFFKKIPAWSKTLAYAVAGLLGVFVITQNPIESIAQILQTGIGLLLLFVFTRVAFSKELFRFQKNISELEEGDIPAVTIMETPAGIVIQKDTGLKTLINNLKVQDTGNQRMICESNSAGGLEKDQIKEIQRLAEQGKIPLQIQLKESTPFVPAVLAGFAMLALTGDLPWTRLIA